MSAVADPSDDGGPRFNSYLRRCGLPMAVCQAAVNPGFSDPFDPCRDITLDNPKYRFLGFHLMTGKLDWVLLKGVQGVVSKKMGNDDYKASDHRWLMVEICLDGQS